MGGTNTFTVLYILPSTTYCFERKHSTVLQVVVLWLRVEHGITTVRFKSVISKGIHAESVCAHGSVRYFG